jgi:uncharacterized membrane protein YeaQ/YmgE (transglycosylase-associated protein family)
MSWIITLIVGGIIGWLASVIMKTNAQMGPLANIIVGIIGSMLGFWLAGAAGMTAGSPMMGYLISVLGAVVLIIILKGLKVLR